ncbi:MAG: hypothetical protein QW383_02180 [Candidatus Nitrosocaldus sp.]
MSMVVGDDNGYASVLFNLLDGNGINLLVAEDALARICFLSSLVRSVERGGGGRMVYIDLDTVLTAYVMHGIMNKSSKDVSVKMDIFIPDRGRFEALLADACSSIDDDTRLVVLDSIHGFYHLYNGVKAASLNQLLTSYISLLAMHAEMYSTPFLVTSIRKRMMMVDEQNKKDKKLYSTRYLWSKSSTILSARYVHKDYRLLVRVVKHRIDTIRNTMLELMINDIYYKQQDVNLPFD